MARPGHGARDTMTAGEDDASEPNRKALRKEYPSGWMVLAKHPSVALMLDALLDAPPGWEFNQTEWGDRAGISRESVRKHLDLLLDVGVVEEIDASPHPRYRVNEEGPVMQALHDLNGAVNSVGSGDERELVDQDVEPRVSPFAANDDQGSASHAGLDVGHIHAL